MISRRGLITTAATASWATGAAHAAAPKAPAERGAARVGIALGAGGARGFAHIGVLKALDQAGIEASVVVGASAGALVGVFYAAGFTPWQMEEVAMKVREIDVADMGNSKRGLLAGEALQKLVTKFVGGEPLERMKRRYAAVATDLASGELALLRSGDAGRAVRASCSIPGVFVPCEINGREYVDGGLVSPLPVQQARELGADFVIGVDVGAKPHNAVAQGLYEVMLQSFEIMGRALAKTQAQQADVLIAPDTAAFSGSDFGVRRELIQAGYEAGQVLVPRIKLMLAGRRSTARF